MKVLGLVLLCCLLGGCGTYQTLEELEQQAYLTGDWSAVEQRERIIAKRRQQTGLMCPSGKTRYCERWGATERCACMNRDSLRDMLNSW